MARYNIRTTTTRSWPISTNHQLTQRATSIGTAQDSGSGARCVASRCQSELHRFGDGALSRIGRWYPRQWKKNWGTVTLSAVGMFGEGAGWGVPPDLDRRKNRDSKRRRQLEPATP